MLRRAIFISIVCHLAMLLSLRDADWFGEPASHAASVALEARLRTPEHGTISSPSPKSVQPMPRNPPEIASRTKDRAALRTVRPDLAYFRPSTATDEAAASGRETTASSSVATAAAEPAVAQKSEISPEGMRQYRLNLAREARRFKNYPSLARERGWEGVVVVVVNAVAGGGVPQIGLSQSSGFALLDEEARKLVSLAAQTAMMPDSLRNRQFALTLPIHYRLDD